MTFSIGWTYGDHAFLVADTLVSSDAPHHHAPTLTSFGEILKGVNLFTDEAALKLMPLRNRLLVSGVGDARSIFRAARLLDRHLAGRRQFEPAALGALDESAVPYAVIIASATPSPRLCVYDRGRWEQTSDTISGGSWAESLQGAAGHAVSMIPSLDAEHRAKFGTGMRPSDMLACVLGACQLMAAHNPSIDQGVGGAFVGATIGPGGIRWMRDTLYLVYQPGTMLGPSVSPLDGVRERAGESLDDEWVNGIVFVCHRRGGLQIYSHINGVGSILTNEFALGTKKRRLPRSQAIYFGAGKPDWWSATEYVTLLSRQWPMVAVVAVHQGTRNAVRVSSLPGGNYFVQFPEAWAEGVQGPGDAMRLELTFVSHRPT